MEYSECLLITSNLHFLYLTPRPLTKPLSCPGTTKEKHETHFFLIKVAPPWEEELVPSRRLKAIWNLPVVCPAVPWYLYQGRKFGGPRTVYLLTALGSDPEHQWWMLTLQSRVSTWWFLQPPSSRQLALNKGRSQSRLRSMMALGAWFPLPSSFSTLEDGGEPVRTLCNPSPGNVKTNSTPPAHCQWYSLSL